MGTRFQFGLERVRDLRAHAEEQAKEQFAASLTQRAHGEAMLREAEHRLEDARVGHVGAAVAQPISGVMLLTQQAYVERLERSCQEAVVDLQRADQRLAADRAVLARASQDREVLDQLEARQRAEHQRVQARIEDAEIDEMALRVHARRSAA